MAEHETIDGWESLSDQQQQGMTREFWEGLTAAQRGALVAGKCIQEGCVNDRWLDAGSFYCEEHARAHSAAQEAEHDAGL